MTTTASEPVSPQPTGEGDSAVSYRTAFDPQKGSPALFGGNGWLGVRPEIWLQLSILAGLFGATFWPNLRRLWEKTNPFYGEPNWGHAICVPLIGLYYLWINREDLLKQRVRPVLPNYRHGTSLLVSAGCGLVGAAVWGTAQAGLTSGALITVGQGLLFLGLLSALLGWGLGTSVFGLVAYAYGIYPGQNDYLKDLGMVITLFGVVLMLFGWDVMQITAFPIVFLIAGLPWPGLVYSKLALPLQELAATVAVGTLNLSGVASFQDGSKIFIGAGSETRTLNVAEACAGLRSLMTFIAVGAAVAFLSARPLWQKIVITASAVPIAILANVTRVSGQGLLDTYVSQKLSENFAHAFVGLVMLVPAFFLILLVGWVLDQLFIEEVDEAQLSAKSAQAAAVIRRRGAGGQAAKVQGEAGRAANSLPAQPVPPARSAQGVIPPPRNLPNQ
jgi:exosortase